MCRFVAYLGQEILLSDILISPSNSIIKQSLHAKETHTPTNGDGFGIGWYTPSINQEPALFTSLYPAWNDNNLHHLSKKIISPAFFAHVRAASMGGVTHYNCHPFIFRNWMFMHNGGIHHFLAIKRHLRHLLDDDIYHWVKGQTDSEHFFGLILQLAKKHSIHNATTLTEIILEAFNIITNLTKKYAKEGPSYYNLCLTDGKQIIATRYCTHPHKQQDSLHYAITKQYALVSSEKLTHSESDWKTVPPNHILTINQSLCFQITHIL